MSDHSKLVSCSTGNHTRTRTRTRTHAHTNTHTHTHTRTHARTRAHARTHARTHTHTHTTHTHTHICMQELSAEVGEGWGGGKSFSTCVLITIDGVSTWARYLYRAAMKLRFGGRRWYIVRFCKMCKKTVVL